MKRIVIFLFLGFLGVVTQTWADTVETTSGTIYQGTIIKMDENEIIIKTATGTARVPRSKVKFFQSDPLPGTSSTPITSPLIQSPIVKEKPTVTLSESAKEAIRALKKLEARCQAGISYKDYGPALGDAKFAVNLFLESPEAKVKDEFTDAIKKVMSHYETGGKVWQKKFSGRGVSNVIVRNEPDYGYFRSILELYPKAMNDFNNGGAILDKRNTIVIDPLVSIIWEEAFKELKRATNLLSQ
jgi:hypothetical protein